MKQRVEEFLNLFVQNPILYCISSQSIRVVCLSILIGGKIQRLGVFSVECPLSLTVPDTLKGSKSLFTERIM